MLNIEAKILCMLVIVSFFYSTSSSAANRAPWVGESLSGVLCTGLGQGYGPYDYTKRTGLGQNLRLVESAHFKPGVEMLTSGTSQKEALYSDLDYTLRAFPNHHRALNTLIRFLGTNVDYRKTALSPPECYFLRALHFAPKDSTTQMLYGMFLHKLKEYELALKSYKIAEMATPSNAQLQYNIGLLYIDMKNYEAAKSYALKTYAQNFPFQGLKKKLKKAGFWQELKN